VAKSKSDIDTTNEIETDDIGAYVSPILVRAAAGEQVVFPVPAEEQTLAQES
jgi:hypothetical protein